MGASDQTSLPKNCPSAQQFADFFQAKVAAVREATAGGEVTTELPPATEVFDHFQLCTASDIRSAIMSSPSKHPESVTSPSLPTDMLKSCLPELLPFITELCNASLQQGCLPLSQRHAIIRPRLKKAGSDSSDVQNNRPVSNLAFMAKLVACIEEISNWMSANHLKLNTDKTQFIWLGTPHQLPKVVCDTRTIGGTAIQVSTEAVCLGVLLDSALTFAPHVRRLTGRSFYYLRQMRIMRKSLTQDAAETMVHAFVTSRMDYCNSILYGASTVHIQPLQNVFNAAARLILHKGKYDRITAAIRDSLHWLPVQQRIEYKICVLVYKCLHQAAPIYLSELCIPVATFAGRSHLRSAVKECLVIGYCRTKNYGQRSFSYSGPTLWNSLPLTVRDLSMSLLQFCARLKTEMFCRAYDWS